MSGVRGSGAAGRLSREVRIPVARSWADVGVMAWNVVHDARFAQMAPAHQASLLRELICRMSGDGRWWTKYETWANDVGTSKRSAERAAASAIEVGLITREPHAQPDGRQGSTTFRLDPTLLRRPDDAGVPQPGFDNTDGAPPTSRDDTDDAPNKESLDKEDLPGLEELVLSLEERTSSLEDLPNQLLRIDTRGITASSSGPARQTTLGHSTDSPQPKQESDGAADTDGVPAEGLWYVGIRHGDPDGTSTFKPFTPEPLPEDGAAFLVEQLGPPYTALRADEYVPAPDPHLRDVEDGDAELRDEGDFDPDHEPDEEYEPDWDDDDA